MKTIFVTAAASGIGRATAHLFAQHGYFVGCLDLELHAKHVRVRDVMPTHS